MNSNTTNPFSAALPQLKLLRSSTDAKLVALVHISDKAKAQKKAHPQVCSNCYTIPCTCTEPNPTIPVKQAILFLSGSIASMDQAINDNQVLSQVEIITPTTEEQTEETSTRTNTKYQYPADITTAEQKKAYRRAARKALKAASTLVIDPTPTTTIDEQAVQA